MTRFKFLRRFFSNPRLELLEARLQDANARQSEVLRQQQLLELRLQNTEQTIRELTEENAQLVEALMGNGETLPDLDQAIIAVKQRSVKREIFLYTRRLAELKEQAALRGLDTPSHIIIEIEMIEEKIDSLQEALSVTGH